MFTYFISLRISFKFISIDFIYNFVDFEKYVSIDLYAKLKNILFYLISIIPVYL